MKVYLGAVCLFCLLVVSGCGVTGSSGTPATTSILSSAASTTPVFKPASLTGAATSEWSSGNPLYSVYFSLREFVSPRDEGVVDRSNLYKLLYDVDTVVTSFPEGTPGAERMVSAPFSGLGSVMCDTVQNDTSSNKALAKKETEDSLKAIATWIWSDAPKKSEYGVAVVDYDKGTKDLGVEMTYSVDYDTDDTVTDYNLRCSVSGNAETNQFQFRYIICNVKIVAKGISKGAGNYMLFKYTDGTGPAKYIVVPSDSDETFFIAQNSAPTAVYTDPALLPSSVAAYKDWVVATDFLSDSDLVDDSAEFNSGSSGAGTIYFED